MDGISGRKGVPSTTGGVNVFVLFFRASLEAEAVHYSRT